MVVGEELQGRSRPMSESYVPFDLKVSKLTGKHWSRSSNEELAEQLLDEQGADRNSVENRFVVVFNHSTTSDVRFLEECEPLIIKKFVKVCKNPHKYVHRVWNTWQFVIVIQRSEWRQYSERGLDDDQYDEFSEGKGLRDRSKADWSNDLVEKIHKIIGQKLLPNPNKREHGVDFFLLMENDRFD